MEPANTPVVFVHGLWLHATSWDPWIDLFKDAGYTPVAPGWPGDADTVAETRSHPEQVAGKGIEDVVQHYAGIIRGLPGQAGRHRPLLRRADRAAAARGRNWRSRGWPSTRRPSRGCSTCRVSALRVASIALRKPANRNEAQALTPEQFRYGFGNALPSSESAELFDRYTIPSPGKPLFEAALANFTPGSPAKVDTRNKTRGPLLLTSGGQDHTVPPAIVHATRRLYHRSPAITDLREFPDRGHSLTIDHGWRDVAQEALNWLQRCLR